MNVVQYYSEPSKISTNSEGPHQNWVHLPQCQSTNDELLAMLNRHRLTLPEGFLLSTDFQTAGRGMRGNTWESAEGKNLMFSVVLYPVFLDVQRAFWLSATVAISVAETLLPYLPEVQVKWPNDIMVNGLKIGGMLVENAVSGSKLEQSVIGIGLNVNQEDLLPTATSLIKERHAAFDREKILGEVVSRIFQNYHFLRLHGWEKVRSKYLSILYKMAIPHSYKLPDGKEFRAVLKGVSDNGELQLLAADGERRFRFKEVSF